MNRKISLKTIHCGLWMGAMLLGGAASADTLVTFQVDMSAQIANSTFNPATDTVWAQGSFNGWGHVNLAASSNPNVYTNTIDDTTDANGAVMSYKFGNTQNNYESPLAEGNGSWNRVVTLPTTSGASLSLPYTYFDDAGPDTTYSITFQVDMAQQLQLGNFSTSDSVFCQGWFEGWSDSNFQLTNNSALNTTNAEGTCTSLPYQGTFTNWSVSPGEQSDFKFVYNNESGGGDQYEGVSSVNANPPSGNRFFFNAAQVLPLVWYGDQPFVPPVTNNVTFIVDMSVQAFVGNFTAANTVEIHGDYNGWGGGTTMVNTNASNTNLFYTTIQYVAGPGLQKYFKYVIQPGTQWENVSAANAIGGNRWLDIAPTSSNYNNGPVYFSDEGPATEIDFVTVTNCMVTFTVDMTNAVGTDGVTFDGSVDQVYLNGLNGGINNSFWSWGALQPPTYQMTNIAGTDLYSIVVPINYGQNMDLQYKYGINGIDDEAGFQDNHYRWIRSLPDYTMPVDVFGSQGATSSTEIGFGNLAIANTGSGNVQVSWLGRRGVEVQTASSLNGAWTSQPLTDGTNLIVAPGGTASTNYAIGNGNLFYRLVGPQ